MSPKITLVMNSKTKLSILTFVMNKGLINCWNASFISVKKKQESQSSTERKNNILRNPSNLRIKKNV